MRYGDSAISLLGLAVTLLAWIIPQDRIGYEVKFTLLGVGLTIVCLGLWLLVRGWRRARTKQQSLDQLSENISRAIRDLVNMPRSGPGLVNGETFANTLASGYSAWCTEVDRILEDKRHFTQSDLLHFQRLGFIQPIHMTGHSGADHTLAMLNLKIERLRDIIAWNR
jgi:hypothetical protein